MASLRLPDPVRGTALVGGFAAWSYLEPERSGRTPDRRLRAGVGCNGFSGQKDQFYRPGMDFTGLGSLANGCRFFFNHASRFLEILVGGNRAMDGVFRRTLPLAALVAGVAPGICHFAGGSGSIHIDPSRVLSLQGRSGHIGAHAVFCRSYGV